MIAPLRCLGVITVFVCVAYSSAQAGGLSWMRVTNSYRWTGASYTALKQVNGAQTGVGLPRRGEHSTAWVKSKQTQSNDAATT